MIDLSHLSPQDRQALLTEHAKGLLKVAEKAADLNVETGALRNTLDVLSQKTREVAATGVAVTVAHTQTTTTGRTEILIGNTKQAMSGKLTKSQTGEEDRSWIYWIVGVIAFVVIVAIIFGRH